MDLMVLARSASTCLLTFRLRPNTQVSADHRRRWHFWRDRVMPGRLEGVTYQDGGP